MKETTYVSIVVYVHNNEKDIVEFLLKMDDFLNRSFVSYEIILVNDNSTDNTIKRVFEVKDEVKGNVSIVNVSEKHGIDKALLAGTDVSIGDFIFEIESLAIDYPIEIMLDMYKQSSEKGYDIVFAKRNKSFDLPYTIYSRLIKSISSNKIEIENNHLRLVSRRALYALMDCKNEILTRSIIYKNSGFDLSYNVYNPINTKKYNSQKLNKKNLSFVELLMVYTKLFDRAPFILSTLFLTTSLFLTLAKIFNWTFISNALAENWIIVVFISLGFTFVFLILGIIYKSLNMLLNTQLNVKAYKVKNIQRLNRY